MIKPLDDRIFIKRVEAQAVSDGGIILPETIEQTPMEGTVVAAGPGKYKDGERIPLVVNVGDRVLFTSWASKEIEIDEETYSVMIEDDIIGILK